MTWSQPLNEALKQPNGAIFYRCALQINPFAYHGRHNKQILYKTEDEYNKAIVDACLQHKIDAIAVTDHYRIADSWGLIRKAREKNIFAFGGFEASSKDGVHFLCLYDPSKDDMVERFIGEFGVHRHSNPGLGNKDCIELMECVHKQGGIAIAAHVCSDKGLLTTLKGQSRINAWKSLYLLASAIPGPIADAPQHCRPILENKEGEHRRERPVAIINSSDVNGPEALGNPQSSSWIKMSAISIEGLRQAFLDPGSRIRLNADPVPESHSEFVAIAWEGGFLDGVCLHFNENLNVLVGGRGTGKSTIIESIRYVLAIDPLGEEARKAHEGIIKHVLKNGTKISLLVRMHHPDKTDYAIERTIPNPSIVKDARGNVLTLTPRDIFPGVQVFGQHEISELTKSREKLTVLLERFVERDPFSNSRKASIKLDLERSRKRILDIQQDITLIDEHLATLPSLEEMLQRFQKAGLEDVLKEKSLLVREEPVLNTMKERFTHLSSLHQYLLESTPIDMAFLSEKALEGLPNRGLLAEGLTVFNYLNEQLQAISNHFSKILDDARANLSSISARWETQKKIIDDNYERLLRDLQKSKIDGAEFIRLRQQIEQLKPLREKKEKLTRDLNAYESNRCKLLDEWTDLLSSQYRSLEKAAQKVSRKLGGRVQVKVTRHGNYEPLEKLLREEVGGNLTTTFERIRSRPAFSLLYLANRCREGKESLVKYFDFPPFAAERLTQSNPNLFMLIEELELSVTTEIQLNTASDNEQPTWQTLEALSTGQKATAVLLLLLLESQAPLAIDQPEDDLDNRFITDSVVPTMKEEKRKRQFVFSTHNANIPVLGDAELIIGLSTGIQNDTVQGCVSSFHVGSIDIQPVREMVEEILEGGKAAFEMRRQKYGF